MEQKSTVEIDRAIVALSDKITAWQTDSAAERLYLETLEKKRDKLRSKARRDGDRKASIELIEVRQSLATAMLEIDDIAEEIAAATREIESLQKDKLEAQRLEAWDEAVTFSGDVIKNSVSLDILGMAFVESLRPHVEMLQRLNSLLAKAGINVKGFSLETFRRCLDEKFRTGLGEYFGRTRSSFSQGQRVRGKLWRHHRNAY